MAKVEISAFAQGPPSADG